MKTLIILIGHGRYATGLQSSIYMISGPVKDLYSIDFTIEDSDKTLKEKINKVLKANKNTQVLIVCDILGGTPFKVAAEISNNNKNIEVVAGCNLSALLEVIFNRDKMSINELAKYTVDESKNTTVYYKKLNAEKVDTISKLENGI